jgi:ATP-dependent protease HslVU (ClpYQ) peptidase subunit
MEMLDGSDRAVPAGLYDLRVATRKERDVLEEAVRAIAERAADAYALIEELAQAGVSPEHDLMNAAKRLRIELLTTKGEIERKLCELLLDCRACSRRVHWVSGVGPLPGHWAHAEPAPDHVPVL